MAQFTFTLQELESLVGNNELKEWFKAYNLLDYLTPEEITVIRTRNTWNEDKLAQDIIDHYYLREIGLETPALFKLKLKAKLNDVFEEKAPLLYTMSLKFDPLNEFEITENSESHDAGVIDNNGSSLQINSTTPQGEINKSDILGGRYASSTVGNENSNISQTGNDNNTSRTSKGHNSSPYRLIQEYRNNIIAFNKDIISDLSELFIGIYG